MIKIERINKDGKTYYVVSPIYSTLYAHMAFMDKEQLIQLREAIDLLLKWEE